MINFRVILASSVALTLTGCGSSASDIDPNDDPVTASIMQADTCNSSTIETTPMDQQEPMMKRCTALHQYLRNAGVIEHGGVRPGVNFEAWSSLTSAGKAEVLLSAACLQSAGLPGPQSVVVVEAGTDNVLASEAVSVRDPLQVSN